MASNKINTGSIEKAAGFCVSFFLLSPTKYRSNTTP
jgi:hypothetical protein